MHGAYFSNQLWNRITLASNDNEATPKSLCQVPNGVNGLPEMHFNLHFNLIAQSTMGFFNRPIMVCTQILIHRW